MSVKSCDFQQVSRSPISKQRSLNQQSQMSHCQFKGTDCKRVVKRLGIA